MRGADKLLQEIEGISLLTRSAHTALASNVDETIAVLGANRSVREAALAGLSIRFVVNEGWRAGMAGSIATGVMALSTDIEAVIVMLADMPDIDVDLLNRLIAKAASGAIVRPVTGDGKPGNPVLFSRAQFCALATLTGDEGARDVIAANRDALVTIPAGEGIHTDLDTPEAWTAWRTANEN